MDEARLEYSQTSNGRDDGVTASTDEICSTGSQGAPT